MPHLFGEGGTVLVEGPKFDLPEIIESARELIDALVRQFGNGQAVFTPDSTRYMTLPWPGSGAETVKKFWLNAAGLFDVVDLSLEFSIGPLTAKVFLLGKTWCVYHKGFDLLRTPRGEPVSALDPTPIVCIYGQRLDEPIGSHYQLLDSRLVSAVEELLSGELAHLDLAIEKSEPLRDQEVPWREQQVAFIRFPHARYGLGRGPIRVRCVMPDGGEVSRFRGNN